MNSSALNRFLDAQEQAYATALGEIRNGKKASHWMWFIFPQLQGLGRSHYAQFYGLSGLSEAKPIFAIRSSERGSWRSLRAFFF